jgi:AI-2 transport protein TqsA
MAMYIAALCLPIYSWLLGRGMRKNIALVVMLGVVLLGFAAIGLLLIAGVDRVRAGLSEYAPGLNSELPAIQAVLTDLGIDESTVDVSLNSEVVISFLTSFLGAISGVLGDLLFSLILVAFFLLEVERFFDLADTQLKDRPIFGQAPVIAKTAVTYFGIRTRLNLLTGVLIGIALLLLGVDYAILWGLLAFVLSYIPYIGLFTAMIPPTILAFAEYGLTRAILVIVVALGVNLLIENILEPTYTGAKLRLSPTIVFLSFFLWAWLLGPIGALLSMPITVMILLALDQHESTRWAARLMGSVRE